MSMSQRMLGWVATAGLLAAPAAEAAYLYSFTGINATETQSVEFSFQSPNLITTEGPIGIPSFSFEGLTYTQGYFGAYGGSPCFGFATAGVGSGSVCGFGGAPANEAFSVSNFAAPTTLGTHDFTFFAISSRAFVVTRLTISSVADVPEPGTLALLAFGLLSLGARARRRGE